MTLGEGGSQANLHISNAHPACLSLLGIAEFALLDQGDSAPRRRARTGPRRACGLGGRPDAARRACQQRDTLVLQA